VIHRDVRGSLEAYYQEAGRAGRDGEFARCVIIYRPADLGRAAFLNGTRQLTREEVVQASTALAAHPETNFDELLAATGLSKHDYRTFVKLLQNERIIEVKRDRIRLLQPDFDPHAVSIDGEERRKAYEASRVEMMRSYAEAHDCRRRSILSYFGETEELDDCGWCNNDVPRSGGAVVVAAHTEAVQSSFTAGDPVVHEQWGVGIVERVDADTLTVMFETVGHRSLALDVVQENDLLRAA
jgi:ATP-dependent DNA helicase RecQ